MAQAWRSIDVRRAHTGCQLLCSLLLNALLLSSCSYSAYQRRMQTVSLPQATWQEGEPISFCYLVEHARMPYTLYIYVRYDNRYEYTTLPLMLEIHSPLGWSFRSEISLPLVRQRGIWAGDGYALQQQIYQFTPPQDPPHPGLYAISLKQQSGLQSLAGVESIGVALVCADD